MALHSIVAVRVSFEVKATNVATLKAAIGAFNFQDGLHHWQIM